MSKKSTLIGKIDDIKNNILYCKGFSLDGKSADFFIPLKKQDGTIVDIELKYCIGDIVSFSGKEINTFFYANSKHNAFFITEKCNNNCLMCSQPPVKIENTANVFGLNNLLLELLPNNVESIGITGGEPTLFYKELIDLIKKITLRLPDTAIHILTNGRLFNSYEKVNQLTDIYNRNIILGIPLHSDVFFEHDFIAQAKNSFYQTMKGLYNLASNDIRLEIRIVISKQNYNRLQMISDFIYKNLPFVEHIAFMSLEYIGNVVGNFDLFDISPLEYQEDLALSVLKLKRWGLNVSVYNIPLCLLKPTVFEFAKKSISDWKRKYLTECEKCVLEKECCGLFATSVVNYKVIPFS